MTRSPSYLWQNRYGYNFRIRVPQDLQTYWGKKELKRSLQTGYLSQARSRAMLMGGRYQQMFKWVRCQRSMGKLTEQEIQDVVDRFVAFADESDIWDENNWEDSTSLSPEELRDKINRAGDAAAEYDHAASTGDYSEVTKIPRSMEHLLQEAIEDPPPVGSKEFQMLCQRASEAMRDKWEAYRKRHVARLTGVVRSVSDGVVAQQQAEQTDQESTVSLTQLIEEYTKMKLDSDKWKESTVRNHSPKMNAMLQVFGPDKPINQIAVEDARKYAKILGLLPPRFAMVGYEDLSKVTPAKLKGKHKETLDVSTRREYLNLARSLFAYALENEYVEKNPIISGLIPPKKENPREQRLPFDTEDLKLIFSAETYLPWSNNQPSRFFIPLLALYTGSRLEEMANLYCEDVFNHEGLWCIEHNFNNGRKLKNRNSVRTIPLHPLLVDDFKFPQYVDSVRSEGYKRVFPELTIANGKYSHNWGKAFSRYLRDKVEIDNPKKTFHSFRHTATNHLFNKMVSETAIEELRGGAGKTEGRRRYFKGYLAKTLFEECILKLDYGIDLTHLKNSKYAGKK